MSNADSASSAAACLDGWGFKEIARTFGLAIHPTRLILALGVVILVYLWGSLLDVIWLGRDRGVTPDAIASFQAGLPSDAAGDPSAQGVFEHWYRHQMRCLDRLAWATLEASLIGPVDPHMPDKLRYEATLTSGGVLPVLAQMVGGVRWMLTEHTLFALLFLLVALAVAAAGGGAIVRQAALAVARGEQPSLGQSVQFAADHYVNGFLLAILVPVGLSLAILAMLGVGGAVLAVPWVGDLLGGLAFPLALVGGFVIALWGVGVIVYGSLLWPVVAAEGTDGLDAISRAIDYIRSRPIRFLLYTALLLVYGAATWILLRAFVMAWLWATLTGVGWLAGQHTVLRDGFVSPGQFWVPPLVSTVFPNSLSAAGSGEVVSAFLIKFWVMLILGALWAFPWCFYLCGCTVVYFLLRREVDAVDMEEIFREESAAPAPAPPPPQGTPGDTSLNVLRQP